MPRIFSVCRALAGMLLRRPIPLKDRFNLIFTFRKDPWRYLTSAYEQEKYRETLAILPRKDYSNILEVGCAEGVFTKMLATFGGNLLAVDISEVALRRAEARCGKDSRIRFRVFDLLQSDPDEKFDLIVCSEVLYYLEALEQVRIAKDRIISWLVPAGHLLLCHMRRRDEDGSGWPPPLLGYPRFGSKPIHALFREDRRLRLLAESVREGFLISFLEKEKTA